MRSCPPITLVFLLHKNNRFHFHIVCHSVLLILTLILLVPPCPLLPAIIPLLLYTGNKPTESVFLFPPIPSPPSSPDSLQLVYLNCIIK